MTTPMARTSTDPLEPITQADAIELPSWLPSGAPIGRPGQGRSLRARSGDMANRLLDAGREAFWTHGYEASRVDDIVSLAGASHGTFYLYFRNKEDLLHRLALGCAQDLRELAGALEAIEGPPTVDELVVWLDAFATSYRRNGPVIRVWLERRDLDPLMQALANEVLGRLAEALGSLVDPSVEATLGPGLVRLSLLSMVERFTAYYETSQGVIDRAEVMAVQARLMVSLMVPRGSHTPDLSGPNGRRRAPA